MMLGAQLSRAATRVLSASRWLASEVSVVPPRFSRPADVPEVIEIRWQPLRDEIVRTGALPLWPTSWVGAVELTLREGTSRRRRTAPASVPQEPARGRCERRGSGAPWLPLRGFIVRTWGDVRWPARFSVDRLPVVARYRELVELHNELLELKKKIDRCERRLEALEKSDAA
jgi:hypothetical protein